MSEETTTQSTEEDFLRVAASSSVQSLASAIAHAVRDNNSVKLRAVGGGAVNQAVKAIAISRGYVAPLGLDLVCVPGFSSIESHDGVISAIVFTVFVK